jgi:two-component system chemotaxis sensor kinase CheA
VNKQELAHRLMATFLDELDEQLGVLNADVLALESDPTDADRLRSVFRVAHTLKGAARAVDALAIEGACHALESLLSAVRAGTASLGSKEFERLFGTADALADAGLRLRAGQTLAGSPIVALAVPIAAPTAIGVPVSTPDARPTAVAGREVGEPVIPPPTPADEAIDVVHSVGEIPDQRTRSERALRVGADKLDALFAGVGELTIASACVSSGSSELEAIHESMEAALSQWRHAARRLRRQAEPATHSPDYELLAETGEQFERLARRLTRLAADAVRDARTLRHGTEGVSDLVRSLRMRPFADICEALPRVARDVAAASGKEVHLRLTGTDVDADRAVLDGIREAVLHLVRNAVDHGIEQPSVRTGAGKPRPGTVTVGASLRGDRLIVSVSDDGGGIDADAMRHSLARAGRVVGSGALDLKMALLRGGVSTRTEASAFSGRGVGIDVARAAVMRMGGRLDVRWEAGIGTSFTLECPLTLARIRAVMTIVGSQTFALPTAHVERLVRLPRADIRHVDGRDVFSAPHAQAHSLVPIVSMAKLLGPPLVDRPLADHACVALLDVGGERLGIIVDELRGEQELIVRALPASQSLPVHLSGAALLPAGGIALVLDASSLVFMGLARRGEAPVASAPRHRPTVLVVDDSLTTRTLERSVLEAAGYTVLTAVDGADGWRLVEEAGCDLVVSDVEMPRMDGFALCEAIRASERHRMLPVILVTALESPEHHARGLAAGADAYIGKSGFDQATLLDTVEQLLGPVVA